MAKKGTSGSSIPSIDPAALITQQADVNRITQFTPFGTQRFGTVGGEGEFVAETGGAATGIELPPEIFAALESQVRTGSVLASEALRRSGGLPEDALSFEGQPAFPSTFDLSSLPPIPGEQDLLGEGRRVEEAELERFRLRTDPLFAKRKERILQNLANQGIPLSNVAASGESGELTAFERARSDAELDATLRAISSGKAEQSRLLGEARTTRAQRLSEELRNIGLSQGARQQGISEQTFLRQLPFSELAQILGAAAPNIQTPVFQPPAPIDVLGPQSLALSGDLARANLSQQGQQSFQGGLFGLGSAAITAGAPFLFG